jgi:tRNA A-37 threonylcarbamoyl transferase component Bud32
MAGLLALVALAQVYLGADYPIDVVYGAVLGLTIGVVSFRTATPDEVYPISFGKPTGKGAHLDLGPREEATRQAFADQLGMTVTTIEPFGLEGSGGSSPLRMRVEEVDGWLFGKLYSTNHVRADRWYRLARTVMYGRLEDETPFTSVRRLVEYEDYALRVMRDAGIRVAATYGVVELAPQTEYMLVQEFFEGSTALTKADVDDRIIDQGFELIRAMWDNGLAHRDIKPANMVVKEGRLQIVDVSGVSIRPSPWRQAVDLGNMCLVMALRTDADRVYERALAHFSADELAEAFASLQGMAIPTQTTALMKEDGRPLLERFRELAPPRDPESIQTWSIRRIGLVATVLLGAIFGLALAIDAIVAGVR